MKPGLFEMEELALPGKWGKVLPALFLPCAFLSIAVACCDWKWKAALPGKYVPPPDLIVYYISSLFLGVRVVLLRNAGFKEIGVWFSTITYLPFS